MSFSPQGLTGALPQALIFHHNLCDSLKQMNLLCTLESIAATNTVSILILESDDDDPEDFSEITKRLEKLPQQCCLFFLENKPIPFEPVTKSEIAKRAKSAGMSSCAILNNEHLQRLCGLMYHKFVQVKDTPYPQDFLDEEHRGYQLLPHG